jgi:hypothetical protein
MVKRSAGRLVQCLASDIEENPFLSRAIEGTLDDVHLMRLVQQESDVIDNAKAPLLMMAARHRTPAARAYFLGILDGLRRDRKALERAAESLEQPLAATRVAGAGAHSYIGYICWLAMNASKTATALMVFTEFTLWTDCCVRLADVLPLRVGYAELRSYLESYRDVPAGLLAASLSLAEEGLREGDDLDEAVHAAGMLQGHLRLFWEAAAGPLR